MPAREVSALICAVGNLDHVGMSYLLGSMMGAHMDEPPDSPWWQEIAKLLAILGATPKPPASARP